MLDPFGALQDAPESIAHQRVVVNHENPDHPARSRFGCALITLPA
jgi:hypothetical protein